jgi:hypothetical protein
MAIDWMMASAARFMAVYVVLAVAALCATLGALDILRWSWRYGSCAVRLARNRILALRGRREWAESTDYPERVPTSLMRATVRETFGPVALLDRDPLPKRVVHTAPAAAAEEDEVDLFAGLSAAQAHQAVEDLIVWARRNPDFRGGTDGR